MRIWILLIGVLFLNGCVNQNLENFCGTSTLSECSSDSDCVSDGCSGEICRSVNDESYMTACEWKDCYEKNNIECKCVENKCSFK